ncbi:MAG: MarR family winged helix-turn-helix transcriptional regulator [Gammaproteobacteria bacterium]
MVDNNSHKNFLETNLLRLLLETSEWMESEMLKLNQNSEYRGTIAEIKVFNALRGQEKSISELARILGISRQAVHKTIHKLKDKGYLELKTSKDNKKDKKVIITDSGQTIRKEGAEYLIEIEKKVSWNIGERNLIYLKEILIEHVKNIQTNKS